MNSISNDLSRQFSTVRGRKQLIQQYGDQNTMYFGENEHNETVSVSIDCSGIVLNTFQKNGWVRVNYYDANGNAEGESFNGRWN